MTDTILVTGGTGFIAGHIIRELLADGYRVRATVRSKAKGETLEGDGIQPVVADLTTDEGWAEAVAGCAAVLHTASPFPTAEPDDPQTLIRPAVEGTERVLNAAAEANVRRVVVTSSVAAVAYGQGGKETGTFDEGDWTNPDAPDVGAYVQSKTLAERAAWRVAEDRGLALTTINPALVLGPLTSADHGSSVGLVRQLMTGKVPAVPRLGFGVVDVRDVARAHVEAIKRDEAIGERVILSERWMWFGEVADTLAEAFPDRSIATRRAPDVLIRVVALFDKQARSIKGDLGQRRAVDGSKATRLLGIDYTPAPKSILASANALIEHGLV